MLLNYFKIALRSLFRHKGYSVINITGLTFGITGFLLIALYLVDEWSFDTFHQKADRIYRVVETRTSAGAKETRLASLAYQVSAGANAQFPEVENAVRLVTFGRANIANGENKNVFYEDMSVTNQGFLDVFDFEWLEGDKATALKAPQSVILTRAMAEKLFGTHRVLGKTIRTDRSDAPFQITGVLQNFPTNSHLAFHLLFSESSYQANQKFQEFIANDWSSNTFQTYVLLKKETSAPVLAAQLTKLVAQKRRGKAGAAARSTFAMQPLRDVHFHSADIEGGSGKLGNLFYVYVFSAVALFLLFIACINYMNLTTARSANRAKEIGVRKAAGAQVGNLVGQFLVESTLVAAFSVGLSLLAVRFLLSSFNAFTEKTIHLDRATDYRIWLGIAFLAVLVGLISGSYPAFMLSRIKPYLLLKNLQNPARGSFQLRSALVVFQFALSIGMMVATVLVYLQLQYVQTKNLGFNQDQLLVVDINSGKVRRNFETIKAEFAKVANVQSVAVSSRVPGEWKDFPKVSVKTGRTASAEGEAMYFLGADENFLPTFEFSLLQGRNFGSDSPADSSTVLINEAAAGLLGIKEPTGQRLEIPSVDFGGQSSALDRPLSVQVIGIVKDFHYQSLRETIAPMVVAYRNNPVHSIDYFTVRLSGSRYNETLLQLEAVLHRIDPAHLFEYHFLDQQLDLFYREDLRREKIFVVAAFATIFIACLGLFGLAAYAAEQRTKEIGIRKVLGASISSIVALLSKDFLKLVLVANLIAWPLAWWAMSQWLEDFAYRIDISWRVFAIVGAAALGIALLTISFQAIKAAMANPVKSLRTE